MNFKQLTTMLLAGIIFFLPIMAQVQTSVSEDYDFTYKGTLYNMVFEITQDKVKLALDEPSDADQPAKTTSFNDFTNENFRTALIGLLKELRSGEEVTGDMLLSESNYEELLLNVKTFYNFGSRISYEKDVAGHFEFEESMPVHSLKKTLVELKAATDELGRSLKRKSFSLDSNSYELKKKGLKKNHLPFSNYVRVFITRMDEAQLQEPYLRSRLERAYWHANKFNIHRYKRNLNRFRRRALRYATGRSERRPPSALGFFEKKDKEIKSEHPITVSPKGNDNIDNSMTIKKVEFSVEQGTIDKIVVYGEAIRDTVYNFEFRNFFPIPLKSIEDIHLDDIRLYDERHRSHDQYGVFIFLKDVMEYQPTLGRSRDYSPADGTYSVNENQLKEDLWVKRPDLRYFIRGEVFTDMEGFGEENPNGLVQMELSYNQILNSKNRRNTHFTWSSSVGLDAQISKIENKVRIMPFDQKTIELIGENAEGVTDTTTTDISTFRTLDFMRYSNFRVTPRYNLLKYISEGFNTVTTLDLTMPLYGAIGEAPTNPDSSFQRFAWGFAPEFKMSFSPLNRLHFEPMIAPTLLFFVDGEEQGFNYREVSEKNGHFKEKTGGGKFREMFVMRTQVTLSYSRNDFDYIYIRPALSWSINDDKSVFWQAQLGYSIDIQKLLSSKNPGGPTFN